MRIRLDNLFGEGDFLAIEGHGESKTTEGGIYNKTYCWVYTWSGNKVVAVSEYLDTEVITNSFGS